MLTGLSTVPVTCDSESHSRVDSGLYSNLIRDFAETAEEGSEVEILTSDGSAISKVESRRAYQGLKQSIRYHKSKGRVIPVDIRSKCGRLYMRRLP